LCEFIDEMNLHNSVQQNWIG